MSANILTSTGRGGEDLVNTVYTVYTYTYSIAARTKDYLSAVAYFLYAQHITYRTPAFYSAMALCINGKISWDSFTIACCTLYSI